MCLVQLSSMCFIQLSSKCLIMGLTTHKDYFDLYIISKCILQNMHVHCLLNISIWLSKRPFKGTLFQTKFLIPSLTLQT